MITSLSNQLVKDLVKLKQRKYQENYYLVEGFHLVEEALKQGVVDLIISVTPYDSPIRNELVSLEVIQKIAFTKTSQPIIARCKKIEAVLKFNAVRTLILDDVQDPGNLGTLIRTALSFGYDQVIASNNSVDLYNDKVLRSTQGAHFKIPVIYGDLVEIIPFLQSNGTTVIGSALVGGMSLELFQPEPKLALVVGNEGSGMKQEHIDLCDKIVYIEMNDLDSLNVGVAGGIMMYHLKIKL